MKEVSGKKNILNFICRNKFLYTFVLTNTKTKSQMKTLTLLTGAAFLFASCGGPKPDPKAEMMAKNKEGMQKVADMFGTGNADGLENYVADNIVEHNPDPMIKTTGMQGLKDAIKLYHTAYPDMKMTSIAMVAEGDIVINHINMKGTNSGPYGAMPATNKSIDVNGVDIVRFENGKGVEHWGYWEESKMMQQLGLMHDMNAASPDSAKK
jgi:predicted ester cyclase